MKCDSCRIWFKKDGFDNPVKEFGECAVVLEPYNATSSLITITNKSPHDMFNIVDGRITSIYDHSIRGEGRLKIKGEWRDVMFRAELE